MYIGVVDPFDHMWPYQSLLSQTSKLRLLFNFWCVSVLFCTLNVSVRASTLKASSISHGMKAFFQIWSILLSAKSAGFTKMLIATKLKEVTKLIKIHSQIFIFVHLNERIDGNYGLLPILKCKQFFALKRLQFALWYLFWQVS